MFRHTLFGFVVIVAGVLDAASAAKAGTLDWQFMFTLSNGDTGGGIFVTSNSPSGGPYLIEAINNGSLSGTPITLLAPGPAPDDLFNDNLLYATEPLLDGKGLGFVESGVQWALWSAGGTLVEFVVQQQRDRSRPSLFVPGRRRRPTRQRAGFLRRAGARARVADTAWSRLPGHRGGSPVAVALREKGAGRHRRPQNLAGFFSKLLERFRAD